MFIAADIPVRMLDKPIISWYIILGSAPKFSGTQTDLELEIGLLKRSSENALKRNSALHRRGSPTSRQCLTTVFCLADHLYVQAETMKQVWGTARQSDYQPDVVARSLIPGCTPITGMVVPQTATEFSLIFFPLLAVRC